MLHSNGKQRKIAVFLFIIFIVNDGLFCVFLYAEKGVLAHPVERLVRNQKVTSSSLVCSTYFEIIVCFNRSFSAMEIEKIIESPNTKDLVLVATQFCTFIEKITPFQQQDAMEYVVKIMPLLYIKGILVPSFETEEDNAGIRFVTEEEYETVYLNVKEKFEKYTFFESFNLSQNQTGTYDFAELLTDIYQDLKDFTLLFNKQTFTAQSYALKMCRDAFYDRWGRNITVILTYIHQILYPVREEVEEE